MTNAACHTHSVPTWKEILASEKEKTYFKEILATIEHQRRQGIIIYPPKANTFQAFKETPFQQIKAVILGQDPYHGPGQAHGLSFSVPKNVRIPPSLQNIYKELVSDLGISYPQHGHLTQWAKEGVLLLNSSLSVQAGNAGSHSKLGWQEFTDKVIREISDQRDHVVFFLWGGFARKKKEFIDSTRHLVLEAPHPSPLSAHRGFFGCKHFSKAQDYFHSVGIPPINWSIK